MPGVFHGIGTMNSALRAFQRALDVTGHNIANVNTTGYNRQQIDLNEADPTYFAYGNGFYMGNGVDGSTITRIRDGFLAAQRIGATSEQGRLGSLGQTLDAINGILQEPGGAGVSTALDQFFNSWSALGSNPGEPAYLQQVQQSGATLASRVRDLYAQLQSQKSQTTGQIDAAIRDGQGLMDHIAAMNAEIRSHQGPGVSANDLLDLRDQAVQQLGEIMPIQVVPQPDGSVQIYSGQMPLVDLQGARSLPTAYDANTGTLTGSGQNFPMTSGRLGGLFQSYQKVVGYQSQLDTLANTLRTQVNSVHATGINGLGATGQNFFNDVAPGDPQTGAIDFDLDPAIAADPNAIAFGASGNPGDGGIALTLSDLKNSPLAGLGNQTFGQFYAGLVSTIGGDASYARAQADTSSAIVRQIDEQIQSTSGVSLDDEMASMLRYQRSYQAAAKALSIFDQTTEDLLNMLP